MEINIYTSQGAVRHTTDTTRKESTRNQQLMGDNIVQIVFDHTEELHFKAGDNITFKGDKFTLIQDYKAEVKNELEYHYELKFEGAEGYFKTLPFFHYITNGDQTEKEPEVNYTATLAMTADMAVTSLQKASGDDTWQVGKLAEGDESKYLNFSADSVFDAFGKIADEFKTEWWIEGKVVNFSRCERGDLQTFSAKAGGGLSSVEISTDNELIPNRIYAYGSDRNITKKYTAQGLAYNTRLRLPEGIEYVEVTGGADNIISKTVFFDNDEVGNVYPRRVGIISKVEVGGTTEAPIYYFYDKDIDFDPAEQLIEGTTMMVRFESGMLQGRDFELGYNEKLQRFEIINTQEGDIQVPFGSIIPQVGDKYVLWNMKMPDSYITNAEHELLTVAQEYVDNLNKKTPEITCKSFEPYFDEYGKVVTIGSKIKIEDDRLKGGYIQSRVTKYSYPLFCESQVEFTLAENVSSGRISQIENKLEDVTADNAQNIQATRAVSRRGWRDAQELTTALEALQAELVLIGNPESQFSCSCIFKSNKNNDPNLLAISAGELQHVIYMSQAGDKWSIEGAEFTLAEDTLYYIYLKCSKITNKGNVIVSQTRLGTESQDGYYLFLGGVVSSIFESARIVNIVSGFTQIAGGNITTERIQDPTGKLIIDLTSNPPSIIARHGAKFIGSFFFESAEGVDNIEGIADIKSDVSDLSFLKDAFKNTDTLIDGGVVLSGFIGARDDKGDIVSGMAGRNFIADKEFAPDDESCPMIFAGNTGAITNANSAKTRIYPSGLIDTDRIKATGGDIGIFNIGYYRDPDGTIQPTSGLFAKYATGGSASSPFYDEIKILGYQIRFTSEESGTEIALGTDVLSVTALMNANMLIDNKYNGNVAATGIRINVSGNDPIDSGRHALYIDKGDIVGLRLHTRHIANSGTFAVDDLDTFISVNTDKGNITLNLPSSPQPGHLLIIRKMSASNSISIKTASGGIINIADPFSNALIKSFSWTTNRSLSLTYNKDLKVWFAWISSGD